MSKTIAFLERPGRSAELIRAFDWSSSPLGEPRTWPQSLKTTLGIVLGSAQATNLVWGPDLITFYNDAYRPLLGTRIPDGIGLSYPAFRPDIWPEAKAQIQAAFAGETCSAKNVRVLTCRHAEPEEAFFTLTCSPVFDETSAVEGVISQILETTGDVVSRRALEHELDALRRGLNHLPQITWSTLPDGYHDFYNKQWYEFTGVRKGSTDGEGWNGMFHPDDQERAWARWRHSLRTGECYEIEYRLRRHDGSYRWTLGRASAERDEAGKIVRWYGTCTDIHEHVLAKEQVQSLQSELIHLSRVSAMGSMAATLAHEVNQPLMAAATFAAALRRQIGAGADPQLLIEIVGEVEGAALKAGDIIRRLRGMTLGHGPAREQVAVGGLVRDAVHLVGRESCSVELSIDELAVVDCDPVQIQQVLANIIRNACEAVQERQESKVVVRTARHHNLLRFRVEDNGPGIVSEKESSLLYGLASTKEGGMGIGLAVSRTILEAHGSSVKFRNLKTGGACVYFDLPLGETD